MKPLLPFVLAAAAALYLAVPGSAAAQTATNLKCKGCVGKKDLGKKAVRKKHIKKNAIRGKHIRGNAIAGVKLGADAKPAAASGASSSSLVALTSNTPATILADTITLKTAGTLHVTASWTWAAGPNGSSTCAASLDSTAIFQIPSVSTSNITGSSVQESGSVTAVFEDVAAGSHTLRLLCRSNDIGQTIAVNDTSLAILFVPGTL